MRCETKIILCESCKGSGKHVKEILIDAHRNEYDKIVTTCKTCGGSGRMIEQIKRDLTPYKTDIK